VTGASGPAAAARDHARRGPARESGLTPLADALAGFLAMSGLSETLARLDALKHWAGAVGPAVARVSRAVEVQGDALVVEVATSEWANELSMMKPVVLERLNGRLEAAPVRDVRFRLRSGEGAGRGHGRERGRAGRADRSRRFGDAARHHAEEEALGRE